MNKSKTVLVVGATGNLGYRICRELIDKKVPVRAIVRPSSNAERVAALEKMGVEVYRIDWSHEQQLLDAVTDMSCIVSTLAGLHDVVVDAQLAVLKAAIARGVPRFIPSDFSSDFTQIPKGENRNFDLRKEFQEYLEAGNIRATSIFNGAFADILRYNTPLFNMRDQTIACYEGKADWKIDFTTMDNTAAYTAAAAMDEDTPRFLNIASFSVSPNDLVALSEAEKGGRFQLINQGSMAGFSAYNKALRAEHPEGENELYPRWQQSQYLYSMFAAHHTRLDNDRYEGIEWASVKDNI